MDGLAVRTYGCGHPLSFSEPVSKRWSAEQVLLSEDCGTTAPACNFSAGLLYGDSERELRTRGVGKIENFGWALKWRARDSAYICRRKNPE